MSIVYSLKFFQVAVLCRLQHPNVINFVGVCHTPLCFALELAPMGSLQTILEKLQNEREEKYRGVPTFNMCVGSVLSKEITHLIAFQVSWHKANQSYEEQS